MILYVILLVCAVAIYGLRRRRRNQIARNRDALGLDLGPP